MAAIQSPLSVTPSRSFQSFPKSQDNTTITPLSFSQSTVRTPASSARASLSPSDTLNQHSSSSSSQTPSSGSSSPTPSTSGRSTKQHYQRPSTLHGLKHKLHTSACSKTLHAASPSSVPNRRKSVGHIPLSPLARTPSPSPLPASPTRSPSPLAFPVGHQPGSSNTTQSYSPSVGSAPTAANCAQQKKGFVRAKTAEPGSPLLRRALSPDRLHPRSAENKCVLISPLCSSGTTPAVKAQVRGAAGAAVWRSSSSQSQSQPDNKENESETNQVCDNAGNPPENRLSLNLSGPGELLPRIAEEKDSPTNGSTQETKPTKCDKEEEVRRVNKEEALPVGAKKSDKVSKLVESSKSEISNADDGRKGDSRNIKQADVKGESSKQNESKMSEEPKKVSKQNENKKEKNAKSLSK